MLLFAVALATVANAAGSAGVAEVIIVSKTHFDIGYTARVADVLVHVEPAP